MNASAPKGEADLSDAPTGRLNFGRMGPSDGLLSGSVRTSQFLPHDNQFCDEQPPQPAARFQSGNRLSVVIRCR